MLRRLSGLTAIALILGMAACDDQTTSPRAGTVSVLLTDAPGDVVEAHVTITDIYLQGGAGEQDPPGGRIYLMENGNETHELLSLANTATELVGDVEVPTGTFGQLRVVVSGACIVTADDLVYASNGYDVCGDADGRLHMPSAQQSGFKVLMNNIQITGGDQSIILDFDVSQSFGHQAGQSGMWVMNPVIHGAQVHEAATVVVTLDAGEVDLEELELELGEFSVTLTPDVGDASTLVFQESNGVFRARFLYLLADNGPFDLELVAPEGFTAALTAGSTLTASPATGETVTLDWELESVTEVEEEED